MGYYYCKEFGCVIFSKSSLLKCIFFKLVIIIHAILCADNGGWSRRDSFSRGANSSNPSSSNVYNHSQVKPQTPPVSSTNTLNHRIARRDEPSYHAQNGNTSQHQTVNSRISNNHGADYEKMSSQQAFKRTLPSSLQPSATRALPSSFASDSRLRNLKDNASSSQLHDAYKNRPHGVGPSTSSDRGYIRENFGRGYDEDRFLYQNGGNRILPSPLMLGKVISPQFATSSESAYRSGAGDERAAESDERLIYEAALQVLHSVYHCACRFNSLNSLSCMQKIFPLLSLSGNHLMKVISLSKKLCLGLICDVLPKLIPLGDLFWLLRF